MGDMLVIIHVASKTSIYIGILAKQKIVRSGVLTTTLTIKCCGQGHKPTSISSPSFQNYKLHGCLDGNHPMTCRWLMTMVSLESPLSVGLV